MTDSLYANAASIVGDSKLICPVWEARDISSVASNEVWTKVAKAVYIVLDAQRIICYVGSVSRVDAGALGSRMREHANVPNRQHWHSVMILPVKPEVPESEVRKLEGLVARRLRPYDLGRHPN